MTLFILHKNVFDKKTWLQLSKGGMIMYGYHNTNNS